MKQKSRQKWDSAVEWTSHRPRWELRSRLCVHSAMQKRGGKMLHLKEGETRETGEGRLVFPPLNNEGGEIKQKSKLASEIWSSWLSEICLPSFY